MYIYTTPQFSQQHCYNTQDVEPAKMSIFVLGVFWFLFFGFFLEYNCFTRLRSSLLYNKANQLYVYIYPLPLESPFHTPHPIPPHQVITEHPCVAQQFPTSNLTQGKAFQVVQWLKNLPANQETQETRARSLDQEDPWRWKWQPTSVFLPGKSHGQRNLVYSPWRLKESDTTQQLNQSIYVSACFQYLTVSLTLNCKFIAFHF